MRKYLFYIILLFSIISFANAEDVGYFEYAKAVYESPGANEQIIGYTDHYAPYKLEPVDKTFASISLNGVKGYVNLSGIKPLPKISPMAQESVFYLDSRKLYEYPLQKAKQIRITEPEEELKCLGKCIGYVKVEDSLGNIGYVQSFETQYFERDKRMRPKKMFAELAVPVFEKPLLGSKLIAKLEPGIVYNVNKKNRNYALIETDLFKGYVPFYDMQTYNNKLKIALFAYATKQAPYYKNANKNQAIQGYLEPNNLIYLKSQYKDYGFDGQNYYHKNDVNIVRVSVGKPQYLSADKAIKLYVDPQCTIELDINVNQYEVVEIAGDVPFAYLLKYKNEYAFTKAEQWHMQSVEDSMNPCYAKLYKNSEIIDLQTQKALSFEEEKHLFAILKANNYYILKMEDNLYYSKLDNIKLISPDTPITAFTQKLKNNVYLSFFPNDDSQSDIFIKAKSNVDALAFNGNYVLVKYKDSYGYLPIEEFENIQLSYTDKKDACYKLVLKRNTATLSAIEIDDDGKEINTVFEKKVAIGRRTSPTPLGEFTLGFKETWHMWAQSFSPYCTKYSDGRYIHGLVYLERDFKEIMDSSNHMFGLQVTGGCLRCPSDVARWIYFNCPSYLTQLIITDN